MIFSLFALAQNSSIIIFMIYTSYFAFIPKLPADMLKISIALYTPQWAQIDGYLPCLNPTERTLKEAKSGVVPIDEAMGKYRSEILSKLSPFKIYEELSDILNKSNKHNLALLCYEKPGDPCHRRIVAEWLGEGNSILVPEYTVENEQLSLIL
ncbi:MAG: DUF488 domain-containing protein [Holosporaceae bacterium]|jgi:uncharacterized protein YeaO (DUF488 family)|nr:DUF488 domain-containing protein [Holosporaceae bacterium]